MPLNQLTSRHLQVKKVICKLLNEIDSRVKRIRSVPPADEQEFIEGTSFWDNSE